MPEFHDPRRLSRWPADPSLLTDTTVCPACFHPLGRTVCANCGLDLGVSAAGDLLAAGTAVATAEATRQGLIGRMRVEQEQRLLAERMAASAPPSGTVHAPVLPQAAPAEDPFATAAFAPAPGTPGPSVPQPAPAAPQFAPSQPIPPMFSAPPAGIPPMGAPQAGPARPRRSGIQILMLTVGVILVSIMALFFVLLAYLIASLEVRSILTGLASVAVFGVAVLLSRRRLHGTAEGITALAVVLFLLDLWIVRANGLFGSDRLDGWLYAGLSIGLLTGLLALAARALPLRTLSLSAALLGPVAGFALVQGVLADVDPWTKTWAAFTAVGVGALLWTRVRRRVERGILRTSGMLAAAWATFCAFGAFPDLDAGGTIAFTVIASVWFLTLAVAPVGQAVPGEGAVRPARLDGWGALAAIGLGLAAAGAGLSLLIRGGVDDAVFWLPATVTASAAVAVALLARIPGLARLVPAMRLAALLPLSLAALATGPSIVYSAAITAWGATTRPFSLSAFGTPPNPLVPLDVGAPLGLLLVSGLALAALAALGFARQMVWLPAIVGGFGLVTVSAVIGQPVASAVCLGILAALLLIAFAVLPSGSLRVAVCTVFSVALLVFGTIGLTSTATFPVTAVASVILLAAARQVSVRAVAPAAAAVLAPVAAGSAVIALIVSARLVPAWFEAVTGTTLTAAIPPLWMTVAALLLTVGVVFATEFLGRAEAAVITAVSAVSVGIGLTELSIWGDPIPQLVALAATVAAGLVWQLRGRVSEWAERYVAAAATPAAAVWAVGVAWTEFGPELPSGLDPPATTSVVLAAATVALAAIAPLLFRRRDGRRGTHQARIAWDVSLGFAAAIVIASVVFRPELGWLTLVLLAVAALLVASGDGDIVAGNSPRRHIAWLGLPLAVSGLWLGLARADATIVEYYTLPVAGLLLVILAFTLLRRPTTGPGNGRTLLLAAALAVGLGPSAIASSDAEPVRGLLVLVVSAILVVAGALVAPEYRGLQGGRVFWLAGVGGAVIVGIGRSWLNPTASSLPFEWWSAGAALILVSGGVLWHTRARTPSSFATAAMIASVVVVSLATTIVILTVGTDAWRAVTILLVTCGYIVAASVRDEFEPALRWVSIASGAVLGGAILVTGTADPFELATVPLAVALLLGGSVRLGRDERRGSWPELGPGLALLLLPSLAADFGPNELWRVVALGVAALGVLGAGLALKLQAPTLIGAAVVVLHGLAQLWPWISDLYGSVPWWLWAGIGGVILIVIAATYESRIRDLKAVARGVSSLR